MQIYNFLLSLGLLVVIECVSWYFCGSFFNLLVQFCWVICNYQKKEKKAGDLHRTATTTYPCCLPALGGFSGSWSCKTCRVQM